ncbi:MAG: glutamine synthetase III, partial [Clostridia bacterium]|nr:glutamine synthetase III [Clostridia bacterium]
MSNIPEIFGSLVFNENVMKERLPDDVYKSLKKTIEEGKTFDIEVANVVANAMKEWAIEKGATHFTHWFQPMTGITAEKHDSFISPAPYGNVIMEFSGKELIKGEPDASSFPSGGLRATFEARGYTAWDPTSYAFIKDKSLYIPTAFCSYGGQALDKKTPLLRSMEAINKQILRLLRILGDTKTKSVSTTVGAEQEYFLIEKEMYKQREDLILTGRTLFGAMPPKGQEMEDHYFGVIKPKVAEFMHELDEELWKLGVYAKTKHNEVAPAQHELAPIYATTNIATDHNQITMELMKKIADKHNLACLLHEKPFAGINGSGKHNNWSISTDSGKNLLNPTEYPEKNNVFLLLMSAVIKGIDEYQDLMRISVASAGNDLRLGGNEAPPAIMSIFLGDELLDVLESIEHGEKVSQKHDHNMILGADVIPEFKKDNTDRNRTSPFAFTGNKFEFRMLGSSDSTACPNIMLNTIVADEVMQFADQIEKGKTVHEIVRDTMKNHKRIIFNGNNYSDE